jgi:hypothetical protein
MEEAPRVSSAAKAGVLPACGTHDFLSCPDSSLDYRHA